MEQITKVLRFLRVLDALGALTSFLLALHHLHQGNWVIGSLWLLAAVFGFWAWLRQPAVRWLKRHFIQSQTANAVER